MLRNRILAGWLMVAAVALIYAGAGCLGAAMTGVKMGKRLVSGKSHVRVTLDGREAKENKLKKVVVGHSNWKIDEPISTRPKLSFRITKPEKFGRITYTVVNIFREFAGGFSDQAEFTIIPIDNTPESQLKPDVVYDLGNPPPHLKVTDLRGNQVTGVELVPGMKYKLMLTIKSDRSETAIVIFKTK